MLRIHINESPPDTYGIHYTAQADHRPFLYGSGPSVIGALRDLNEKLADEKRPE